MSNQNLHNDLGIPIVKDVIGLHSIKYENRSTDNNSKLFNQTLMDTRINNSGQKVTRSDVLVNGP